MTPIVSNESRDRSVTRIRTTSAPPTHRRSAPEGIEAPVTSVDEDRPAAIRREVDASGVCHLIFDAPGADVNLFDTQTLAELDGHLEWIESAREVTGLVLRSAKPRIFIAGADLKPMLNATAIEIDRMVVRGQQLFDRLAHLPIPKVAAIHGACLGGGYEITLACDWRIATDDPVTKIGLPETQLGLIPAWGGCTRLPRLIGVRRAAKAILKGTQFSGPAAKKMGMVDEVVPVPCLMVRAAALVARGVRRGATGRAGAVMAPALWMVARRRLRRDTRDNYPALIKALKLVALSPCRGMADSLAAERRCFGHLVRHSDTRNLIRLFFARERARKSPFAGSARPIKRVAVVGAGVMGSGIGYWLGTRGVEVLLLDVDDAALGRARERISRAASNAVARGVLDRPAARRALDRVTFARNVVPLTQADLVIEAATEDAGLKRRLFADLLERVGPDTVLATNTSAIPIHTLLEGPRMIGLHFFNPVHAMPLVEVVRPDGAPDDLVATAVRFVQSIGKLPLVVADRPGFLVNRVLMPYLLDAARLVDEGNGIRLIDDAMLDFGMPMGPLRLLDEVGLDVALHVAHTLADAFPGRVTIPNYLPEWVSAGRLGRKSGLGFYRYRGRGESAAKPNAHVGDIEDVTRRLSLLLTNEAARCLDDGVVSTPAEVDFGMVLGTGYAPFRGGPLRHADTCGLSLVVGQLHHLENDYGSMFAPAAGLLHRAEEGGAYFAKEDEHEIATACEI